MNREETIELVKKYSEWIKIMEHSIDGGVVQYYLENRWNDRTLYGMPFESPSWEFNKLEYRIKPKKPATNIMATTTSDWVDAVELTPEVRKALEDVGIEI